MKTSPTSPVPPSKPSLWGCFYRTLKKQFPSSGKLTTHVLLGVLAGCFITEPVKADIIWVNGSTDDLYRSDDDGQNALQILDFDTAFGAVSHSPTFITVVGNHVYTIDTQAKKIYKCGLNGESPIAIVDTTTTSFATSSPHGLASDGTKLYFELGNRLFSCGLDGSNVTNEFIPSVVAGGGGSPYDAVIHGDWYYYTYGSDGVARVKLDGSAGGVIVDMDASFDSVDWVMRGIATDGLHLYWCAYKSGSGAVYRSNLDGTSPTALVSTGSRIPEFCTTAS
jgi:hypothetical protein